MFYHFQAVFYFFLRLGGARSLSESLFGADGKSYFTHSPAPSAPRVVAKAALLVSTATLFLLFVLLAFLFVLDS